MTGKFLFRTLRNIVWRDHPYFAHLALTHRCNLRCRFCHIQDERFAELDTGGMKRVIDALDHMGVAVLSISGGGEPLLRDDFAEVLNHAAGCGMYTKITSNGTLPRRKYEELLRSRVGEIAISLDGVRGNDLPFSHTGPRILETLRFLNDHLPKGKMLTINVTVSDSNRDRVEEIVAHCTREFPRARIWLNPVVVGDGKLRTEGVATAKPDYLRTCQSPTLLSANFYVRGVEEQFTGERRGWGCRAGRMFFDVKPNGDVWICQDQPSRTPLNILSPDFQSRWRRADFRYRRECSGCTYSCYYVTQEGFQFRNWPDMAALWWKANTAPEERCRQVAAEKGWPAGLAALLADRLRSALRPALAALLLAAITAGLAAQQAPEAEAPTGILEQMETRNHERESRLSTYTGLRRYTAGNSRLNRRALVTVEVSWRQPGEKSFEIKEREGSGVIQRMVIERLLRTEEATARPGLREETEISRNNYSFRFAGYDQARTAYVFEAAPKRSGPYLFRGKVWIDAEEHAIRRIEGEPAQRPSFWVKRTRFAHEYASFGGFWLPVKHTSRTELRLFGDSFLEIEYYDYRWKTQEAIHRSRVLRRSSRPVRPAYARCC